MKQTSVTVEPRYAELAAFLRNRGFQPYMNDRISLMVARHIPAFPDDGNCFFITRLDNDWFLSPMGGWLYTIPGSESPFQLCLDLLNASDSKTLFDVPEDLRTRYHLERADEAQTTKYQSQYFQAESHYPPSVDFDAFTAEMRRRGFAVSTVPGETICTVTGTLPGSQLSFNLHQNHWYIRTPAGIVHTCCDEQIISLAYYSLTHDPPIHDRFPDRFQQGYHLHERPEPA